jgi:hypothetical protein
MPPYGPIIMAGQIKNNHFLLVALLEMQYNFFCIPAFIWQPTRGGLLNLPKPAQNLYFIGDSFQNNLRICGRIFF